MVVLSHMAFFFRNSFWLCCIFLVLLVPWKPGKSIVAAASSGNETGSDRVALLEFKKAIEEDPFGVLSSWNESLHHCDWQGITCSDRHPDRVTILAFRAQRLRGTLSPYIGNLTFLQNFTLTENNFHGVIPQEIGRLFRLQFLSLNNNSFNGEIPSNLSRCKELRIINLIDNDLSGSISGDLSSLSQLVRLGLAINSFTGFIPPSLGNLSSLTHISLAQNRLRGSIPADICRMQNLQFLQLAYNNLTGNVPDCLYNHSNIDTFSVAVNQLEGTLPPTFGLNLPKIVDFYLGLNKFSGMIPVSITNATTLQVIGLNGNAFTGPVPRDLGRLQNLTGIYFNVNQLGTGDGDDLEFLTSLTNCRSLESIDLETNLLRGPLPESISNLSSTVIYLNVGENRVYGSIPIGIGNLIGIERLSLDRNSITGNIPTVIGTFNKLKQLKLNENLLSGQIPASLGDLSQLTHLHLGSNSLTGSISPTLGNLQNLLLLNLSHNNLIGRIPNQVLLLSSISIGLYLQHNSLTGPLPSEVGNLTNNVELDVSDNSLSGHIPSSLGNCLSLEFLSLRGNLFEGGIPTSLSNLRGLEHFDLSRNQLSGEIPKYLEGFSLLDMNLSFNQLEGEVPLDGIFRNASLYSIEGNKNLCGGMEDLKLPPCIQNKKSKSSFNRIFIPVIAGGICLIVLLCVLLLCYIRRTRVIVGPPIPPADQEDNKISYPALHNATNGFSSENLIGIGSYGSVFKGFLKEINKTVAVKVLNLQRQGATKSFLTECRALRYLRHRNLVKIITCCSSMDFRRNEFKALVFEYMPNGSLEEWLYPAAESEQLESKYLNFIQRLRIAIDVASALEYLHHNFETPIVHCDLKPSNVLLGHDMVARVADFGIAKIFSATSHDSSESRISSFVVKGTIGYVPPEYGMGAEVSRQGDVYSYGILLLEMFTMKKPTNDIFLDGLHNHAKTALHKEDMKILAPMLLLEENDKLDGNPDKSIPERLLECLVSLLRLGVRCSVESPIERGTMREVIIELHRIRDYYQFQEPSNTKSASIQGELSSDSLLEHVIA